MKIFKNIGALCFLAKSVVSLGGYKKRIDSLREEGNYDEERNVIAETCHYWSDEVAKYLKTDINVKNPENLPDKGPVVYVANHQSYADILVMLKIVKHQVGFIAKEELRKVPVFAKWVLRIRSLFIARSDSRASLKTINDGAEMIKNGYSLIIFPEGTRSRSGKMADFKPGSLKLATKAKTVIVPVTISNSYKIFEETGAVTKNVTVDVMVHKPINTAELDRKEQADLPEKIETTIREGLKELQG